MTDITDSVTILSSERPGRVLDILGIDTGGRPEERPRIAWTAPDELRVTVPNLSDLKVLTRHALGVRIDLRYEPDDKPAREAWRRKLGDAAAADGRLYRPGPPPPR